MSSTETTSDTMRHPGEQPTTRTRPSRYSRGRALMPHPAEAPERRPREPAPQAQPSRSRVSPNRQIAPGWTSASILAVTWSTRSDDPMPVGVLPVSIGRSRGSRARATGVPLYGQPASLGGRSADAHARAGARRRLGRDLAASEGEAGTRLLDDARRAGLEVWRHGGSRPFGRLEGWLRDSEVDVFHVHAGITWEGQPEARVT